jgi:hypothetical protein
MNVPTCFSYPICNIIPTEGLQLPGLQIGETILLKQRGQQSRTTLGCKLFTVTMTLVDTFIGHLIISRSGR